MTFETLYSSWPVGIWKMLTIPNKQRWESQNSSELLAHIQVTYILKRERTNKNQDVKKLDHILLFGTICSVENEIVLMYLSEDTLL